MNKEPLFSSKAFDCLRNIAIKPYAKLSDMARDQLGDDVRLVALFGGDSSATQKPGQRISVLSSKIRLASAGFDFANCRIPNQVPA